jgi:glycosyltransferase involved in cell wall biosynthesis
MYDISVIIPTYNRCASLLECLRSLEQQTLALSRFEVIVADDGSTDGTVAAVDAFALQSQLQLRVITQTNQGPSVARNAGAALAKSEWLAFTDDDVIVHREWLANGLAHCQPGCHAVEGRIVAVHEKPATPATHVVQNETGGCFLTANMMVNKAAFEAVGGFDPSFRMRGLPPVREDSDLAYSLLERYGPIPFAADVIVYHPTVEKPYRRFFAFGKYGFFEPLMRKKHAAVFNHPEQYGLTRRLLGDGIPWYYLGSYFCVILLLLSVWWGRPLAGAALLVFLMSHLLLMYKYLRRRRWGVKDFLIVNFFSFILPFTRLYWVARGNLYFRTFYW